MRKLYITYLKILIPLLIISFMITGCNTKVDKNTIPKPSLSISPSIQPGYNQKPSDSSIPSIAAPNVTIPPDVKEAEVLNIIYTADNTGKYYQLSDWQTYIQDKFGIEIYVDYNGKNQMDGVVYLRYLDAHVSAYNTQVLQLSNEEFAYDLSPYYQKYGWDKYIENQYLDALDTDGSIYAVPAANTKYIVPRYYNKEYLDQLNMEVPETVERFREYLLATKELNSSDVTFYPMVMFPMHTLCTADIFRAYGVYFNSIMNSARVFNPNTQSFEDGVFSENIEEAVGFVRQLQSEQLLVFSQIPGEGSLGAFNKKLSSEYNVVYNTKTFGFSPYIIAQSDYERVNGYFLTGSNVSNVCEVRSDLAFYMFPKAIENINETIELFNRVFTDNEFYADLRYGIEGKDYYVLDGIPVKQEPAAGVLLGINQIKPVYEINDSLSPESVSIVDSLSDILTYENNVFKQKWTYSYSGDRDSNQDNHIEIIFNKEISPYDAIEEYKKEFRKSGKLNMLNTLNEKIGVVTTFNYGE